FMKGYIRVVIIIAGIFLLIVALTVGLNLWIKYRLPKIINDNNTSAYQVTYGDITVSLLSRSIVIRDIVLMPRNPLAAGQEKLGLFAKVPSVEIKQISYWNLI